MNPGESFASFVPEDEWDEFGWFSLDIGTSHQPGQDFFQCLVTTTRARHRALAGRKDSRCHVVDPYRPDEIIQSLTSRIESIEGVDWCSIVDQLSQFMIWEYEEMGHHFPLGPS